MGSSHASLRPGISGGRGKGQRHPKKLCLCSETARGEALAELARQQAAAIRERWIEAEPQIGFAVSVKPRERDEKSQAANESCRVCEEATECCCRLFWRSPTV